MIIHNLNKMVAGALLSGGAVLAVGLTAGTAHATPAPPPALTFEQSDFAVPGDGSVRVASPTTRVCDGSVRVTIPAP